MRLIGESRVERDLDQRALHPLRRTYEALLSRKGVVAWDGARILDWYLAQRPPAVR